jgi:AraC family transcriptional regulator
VASAISTAFSPHSAFVPRLANPRRQTSLRLDDCRRRSPSAHVDPADRHRTPSSRVKAEAFAPTVEIIPANAAKRRAVSWPGMTAEIVQATSSERIAYRAQAPVHMLVLCERGARRDGETSIEGLPSSTLRDVTRKFSFVPAGHEYRDWHEPRTPARMAFFYFEPDALPLPPTQGQMEQSLSPRLFFEDSALFATAQKLIALIEGPESDNCSYLQALGAVLAHELVRINQGSIKSQAAARGGLAAWQQRVVISYIEEHLAEPVPLAKLAELASLSPYHFCRAFKQSFGLPPHRYHTSRKIEHAKSLLAKSSFLVTDVGIAVGFSETSSFTAAFHRATGLTPTAYHRSLA